MKLACVFSGQGAQVVGMGRDLADAFPECAALYERADEVLGYDLSRICFEGPDEELTRTHHCQPAIFVTSVAAYTALRLRKPELALSAAAGLSLGEWTALHVADALSFDDALRALEARGRFMQQACDEEAGGMVSVIGMSEEDLIPVCEQSGAGFANINSPGQIVLSGQKDEIEAATKLADEAGAKRVLVLNVAGAYHSRLMRSAAAQLAEALQTIDIKTPSVPVMSNATGSVHGEPSAIREALIRQVTECVQWVKNVEELRRNGVEAFVECGPGKVLTGLIKRIDRDTRLHNIHDVASLEKTLGALTD